MVKILALSVAAFLAIEEASRSEQRTLLAQAPEAVEPWWLIAPLTRLAEKPDRSVAAPAARSLAAIATRLARIEDLDLPADVLEDGAAGCARLAHRVALAADVRVHAMECAIQLGEDGLAEELLDDDEPEVRRAAVVWSDPADDAVATALDAVAADDPDAGVAAAAAAALCRAGREPTRARARAPSLADDPLADPGDSATLESCIVRP